MIIIKKCIENSILHDDCPILNIHLEYPQIEDESIAAQRINRYFQRFCDRMVKNSIFLQKAARKKYIACKEQNVAFSPYQFFMDFVITRNDEKLLSLYTDVNTQICGFSPLIERYGDTFSTVSGFRLTIINFFSKKKYKKILLTQILAQASSHMKQKDCYYLDHPKRKIKKHFSEDRFYLSEKCFVCYYQLYEISPLSAGIPTFSLPLQEDQFSEEF